MDKGGRIRGKECQAGLSTTFLIESLFNKHIMIAKKAAESTNKEEKK
jgi:hypothetical protein